MASFGMVSSRMRIPVSAPSLQHSKVSNAFRCSLDHPVRGGAFIPGSCQPTTSACGLFKGFVEISPYYNNIIGHIEII